MKRLLYASLTSAMFVLFAQVSLAQTPVAPPPPPPNEPIPVEARGAPAMQYFVAVSAAAIVLATVCKPSRKSQ